METNKRFGGHATGFGRPTPRQAGGPMRLAGRKVAKFRHQSPLGLVLGLAWSLLEAGLEA
jgi:hypothetical protein